MSEPRHELPATEDGADDRPSQGPNLVLLYSLLALALVAAIGFALLIVLPFYHRRSSSPQAVSTVSAYVEGRASYCTESRVLAARSRASVSTASCAAASVGFRASMASFTPGITTAE